MIRNLITFFLSIRSLPFFMNIHYAIPDVCMLCISCANTNYTTFFAVVKWCWEWGVLFVALPLEGLFLLSGGKFSVFLPLSAVFRFSRGKSKRGVADLRVNLRGQPQIPPRFRYSAKNLRVNLRGQPQIPPRFRAGRKKERSLGLD